ncbi:MAG: AAA family ATPase, partial [Candidatus Eremiobacterota bacterium]
MLTRLRLTDFKSFRDTGELSLAPLTLLVGANASGKSNLLDAIRFLQGISLQMPLSEVLRGRWEAGREVWPGIRGGAAEVARMDCLSWISAGDRADQFSIVTEWRLDSTALEHEIRCSVRAEPQVVM